MIAVVTGGSGFIGQNLVRRLRRDGHEVRCLMRASGGELPPFVKRYVVRYEEPASLLDCKAFEKADVVFHLAGATRAASDAAFVAANVTVTRNLLGAIAARRLSPRFVHVSSQAAAGPAAARQRAIDEDDIPRPVEPYGRSKLEAERIVESFSDRVPTTIVRPCSVFGPWDRDFLVLFRMARRGVIIYPGIANQWISLLYVDDVIDGLLAAAITREALGRKYFLASEAPVQWRALGALMADAAQRRTRHVDLPRPLVSAAAFAGEWLARLSRRTSLANRSKARLAVPRYWVCSASRARQELGFAPTHSLPEAVRQTYYWYHQSGWLGGSRRAAGTPA